MTAYPFPPRGGPGVLPQVSAPAIAETAELRDIPPAGRVFALSPKSAAASMPRPQTRVNAVQPDRQRGRQAKIPLQVSAMS
jgi:hypothetical protein